MGDKSLGRFSGGYITVVFSMIFLTVISVVLSALEAVRISSVRMQAEIACAISCEAYLSQYHPQVQARYGLYLVQRDGFDILFLQKFIGDNCGYGGQSNGNPQKWSGSALESVVIDDDIGVSDEDFHYLKNQIAQLMVAIKGSDYIENIYNSLTGSESESIDEEKTKFAQQLENTGSAADAQRAVQQEDSNSRENTGRSVEDPRKNITQMLKYPVLSLIMEGEISNAVLDIKSLSDFTTPEKMVSAFDGFMDYRDVAENLDKNSLKFTDAVQALSEDFLSDCYIMDYFNNAVCSDKNHGPGALSYEVEYILAGNSSDALNLQMVINRISLIRMTMNMVYLLGNAQKTALVRAVAAALASAVLMPFLEEIFYLLILAAWAYGEALVDCRCLLNGGKVPLLKTDRTWNLSMEQLSNIGKDQLSEFNSTEQTSEGLDYETYLRLLLLGTVGEKKYIRMLNVIEANIRLEDGCRDFFMDDCVFGISVCADFVFYPLFFSDLSGEPRYVHHVRKSIVY